jgi:G protein-coupled receptor GPR1
MERGVAFAVESSSSANVFARDAAGELPAVLDSTQLHTLKLVSLCLASVSVASALLTFYWFIRIRRSFRHE